ncbi:tobamovirus multiplication protein 1-like isoform x1 [Anaeramoeba ignava]|uniref:Tobamovirus multiplication protein 1-like isoform x1 n=1 Tax=Anaeramoeba ignava TaxID=1746090 RepID=A0A9Q0RI27_ANAIG|nr:tobamovirus multiplication protein 1-like isoform x1 [Anaeramoeba ignava]
MKFFWILLIHLVFSIPDEDKRRNTISALETHSWLIFLLSFLYFLGAVFSLIEIVHFILLEKKKTKSKNAFTFRIIILIENFTLSLERTILTFSKPSKKILDSHFFINFFYLMFPLLLQFTIFILFVWFVALLMYSNYGRNQILIKLLNPFFLFMNVLGVVFSIVSCFADPDNEYYSFLSHGLIFTLLILVLTFFGWRIYRELKKFNLNDKRRARAKTFMILIWLTTSVFFVRSLWDLLNAATSVVIDWGESNDNRYLWLFFTIYLLFEIFPIFSIIVILHSNVSKEKKMRNLNPNEEYQSLFDSTKHETIIRPTDEILSEFEEVDEMNFI